MPNVSAAVVGETVVLVSNAKAPEQAEWDAYLAKLGEHLDARAGKPGRLIVFAGGGTPSSSMRLGLRKTIAERPMKTAVVTDSAVVRGIIGVFSLFVKGTRPFAAREWMGALEYVGFPFEKQGELTEAVTKLNAEVGGSAAVAELLKPK